MSSIHVHNGKKGSFIASIHSVVEMKKLTQTTIIHNFVHFVSCSVIHEGTLVMTRVKKTNASPPLLPSMNKDVSPHSSVMALSLTFRAGALFLPGCRPVQWRGKVQDFQFAQATLRSVPMPRNQSNPWSRFDSCIISHQVSEITRRKRKAYQKNQPCESYRSFHT